VSPILFAVLDTVESVEQLKPTPHPKITPINASQSSTLYYLDMLLMEKECPGPQKD